ncbi:MAG: hypothetical protein QM656_13230 [Paracoccaceae bacterium]
MTFGKTLFARLGLFARKKPVAEAPLVPDFFELRLERIGKREGRVPTRPTLFRTRSAPLAA